MDLSLDRSKISKPLACVTGVWEVPRKPPTLYKAPNSRRRKQTAQKRDYEAVSFHEGQGSARVSFNRKIRSVLSPGTYYSSANTLAVRLPTGERARSVSVAYVWSTTFNPDKNGELILAGLPFAECPFAKIVRPSSNDSNSIESITAMQPEVFKKDLNYMKTQKIYGWRMNAQSMTIECVGNMMNFAGESYAGSVPPSVDSKTRINANGGVVGYARTLDHLPVTPDSLAAVTRAYRRGKASEGVYIVNRHVDASVPFTYRDGDFNKAYSGLWKPDVIEYVPVDLYASTDDTAGVPVKSIADKEVPVTAPSCTDITMAIFKGLQAGCSYSVKFIACIEYMVKMGSPFTTMAQPIEPRSYAFLEALNRAEASKAIDRADANDWGSFFEGLNKAWDFLTPVADTVASVLPGPVGAVAKQIAGINKKLNDAAKKAAKVASYAQPVQILQPAQVSATPVLQTQAQPVVVQPAQYNPAPRVRGRQPPQ